MGASAIAFTYEDRFGQVGQIDLCAMRKLWVDHECAGVVFAEASPDGDEVLHEVVVADPSTSDAMLTMMESLLVTPSLQRVERPFEQQALVLEFRAPQPHVVTLAPRTS